MTEVPDGLTPVNPKFRSGLLALTCYMAWPAYSDKEFFYIGHSMLVSDRTLHIGHSILVGVRTLHIGHSILVGDRTLFTLDTPYW